MLKPTEISAQLERARADLAAAEAAVEAAQAAYDEGLLVLERSALRDLQDAKADAVIDADHARAVVAKLEAELDRATDIDAEATRRSNYDRARELSAAARKRLGDYDRHARKIRDVLAAIAEADVAVMAANADLPEGAAQLERPEDSRSVPGLYREELGNEIVELWAAAGSPSEPLPDQMQRRVQVQTRLRRVGSRYDEDPNPVVEELAQGTVRTDTGSYIDVVKRRFVRRTFLPDQSGRHIANLAAEVCLPPLHAGAGSYWEPTSARSEGVLAKLATPIAPRPIEPERQIETEYKPARNI